MSLSERPFFPSGNRIRIASIASVRHGGYLEFMPLARRQLFIPLMVACALFMENLDFDRH